MLWQLFLLLSIAWICLQQWKRRRLYQIAHQLKSGLRSWPLVGHALMFLGNDEDHMKTIKIIGREALSHGGLTSVWLAHRLYIVIADPVLAEFSLKSCLEKDDIVRFSKYVMGNGSIFAPVSIWRPRRKILAPTFNARNLHQYVRVFAKQSDILAHQLRAAVGTGPFPIWSYLTTYTMDAICETTLGIQLHAQKNPNQPFLKAFEKYCYLITRRMCQPWLHSDLVYKLHPDFKELTDARDCMNDFIKQIIKLKREENMSQESKDGNNNTKAYKTFVDLLFSSNGEKGFSDLELQEESLVIVMAGTDTSAVGTAFTAVMLSWYQDVQEKVYEELKGVFGNSKRRVDPEDLPRLKYLEAVIKETLRLYPPVPLTLRKVTSDLTFCLTLVKGCSTVINIWALHRNQKYWGADAELFRPERFLSEEMKHPAQFAAFSFGARNCVGYQYAMMSSKTVLATILRHYRLLPADSPLSYSDGRPEYKHLRLKFGIMMKDIDNFMVRLEPRC